MAEPKPNLAVTKNGMVYNKLSRPDDYIASLSSNTLPSAIPDPPLLHSKNATKRKHDNDDSGGESVDYVEAKRSRPSAKTKRAQFWNSQKSVDPRCGLQYSFPGLDGNSTTSDEDTREALAYLRGVR